ncbi:class I SAM-dependent RNA methyltransferase [Vitreoscilla stercoraria]|uniref:Class I SAM-dependent RNA methyltransferase n=1 Tax=Vitreoscilla stercoraria TaxID=61 RepID=A0ABY4EEB3_VITST|nr:TRAM domain-containing protein [Vitreoscilla stercoraria]UOO93643.1 class I SAM-dependent RNA methyltransferase [Vitreoscilla stercoraria]
MTHYKIIDLDTMGQGVAKDDGQITFIAKTLPEEIVEAKVYRSKKNIHFAHVIDIIQASPKRQDVPCPHYAQCGGCDYQHVDYPTELNFKQQALQRHLRKFPPVDITVHAAPQRFHYRNRVQLHYQKDKQILGLMDVNYEPFAVSQCQLMQAQVREAVLGLYENQAWLQLVEQEPVRGHIELYWRDDEIHISVNRPYANGGFTQVFPHMNHYLTTWLAHLTTQYLPQDAVIYDLFGGNGNLSLPLGKQTLVVDQYGDNTPENTETQTFVSQNLYAKDALTRLQAAIPTHLQQPTCLIIDPPRSGLKNLKDFVAAFQPKAVIFIACEPTSFARDMVTCLDEYELVQVDLFDLFPATQHYETVGVLVRKDIQVTTI